MTYKIKGDVAIDRNLTVRLVTATDVVSNTVSSTTHTASLSNSFGYDEVAQDVVPATATAIVVDLTTPNRKFEILIDNTSTGDVQINSPINAIDDKDHVVFRVTNNDTVARDVVFTALYTRPNNDQVGLFSLAAGESRVLKAIREGATMWVVTEDTAYVTPANARAFASNTAVAPVAPGYPSTAEIQTYVTTNSITDTLVYYTGTDAFGDTPTHVYWVDQAGTATAVETTAEVVARPFGRMELTNNTATAALGVGVNAATISIAANTPSVLPFSKITHQEGGMVATLGTWTDGVAGSQAATGTRMSFTIPVDGAGSYRYTLVTPNPIDGDIATGDAPAYGIAVNGSVAQVFDIKSGDGDITSFTGLVTLAAGDVVQPVVVIEGGQAEAFTLAVTFGTASLSAYPSVGDVDAVYSYFELEKRDARDLVDPNLIVPTPLHRAYLHAYRSTTLFDTIQAFAGSSSNSSTLVRPAVNRLAFTAAGLTSAVLAQDVLGMTVGTNTITATQAGTYSVDVSVTTTTTSATGDFTQLIKNGTIIVGQMSAYDQANIVSQARTWIVQLAAGDTLDVRLGDESGGTVVVAQYSVAVVQLPVSTVIDPGLVPVNDQSSSGYFDIGGMRHQFGRSNVGNGGTITFPVAFANANYTVVPVLEVGGNITLTATGRTTTGFSLGMLAGTSNAPIAGPFPVGWIATGQKP